MVINNYLSINNSCQNKLLLNCDVEHGSNMNNKITLVCVNEFSEVLSFNYNVEKKCDV